MLRSFILTSPLELPKWFITSNETNGVGSAGDRAGTSLVAAPFDLAELGTSNSALKRRVRMWNTKKVNDCWRSPTLYRSFHLISLLGLFPMLQYTEDGGGRL